MTNELHFYFERTKVTAPVAKLVEINVPMPMLYVTQMKDGQLRLEMSTGLGAVAKFERLELWRDSEPPLLTRCPKCQCGVRSR